MKKLIVLFILTIGVFPPLLALADVPLPPPNPNSCTTVLRYWSDNTNKTCQTQRQFCGTLYPGLQVFNSQQDCLNAQIIPTPSPAPKKVYNFGSITLRSGSRGDAVMELQRFLNDTLNIGLVVDGKLGPKTVVVIKKWQSDHGLYVDGLVGRNTKAKMNESVQ